MAWLGTRVIVAEYALGVVLPLTLGVLSLRSGLAGVNPVGWEVLLWIWLITIWAKQNYHRFAPVLTKPAYKATRKEKGEKMNIPNQTAQMDMKVRLSTLWLFAVANFLYADIVALFDIAYNGKLGSVQFTPGTLLGVSILVEIPMAMVVLSRILSYRANRWTNTIAGVVYTLVTLVTQFIVPLVNGTTTTYYIFFGIIEILTTLFIVWYAWKWPNPQGRQ